MPIFELAAGAQNAATVLSTELNALANGAGSVLSAAVANQTSLDIEAICELTATFAVAPTAESTVDLYLVPALDGTNYGDYTSGASAAPNSSLYVGSFSLRAVTTAQRVLTRRFSLPALSFSLAAVNKSGTAFPATGSVIKLSTFAYQSV